ncbi:hypothetical protein P4377_24340 [Bacillus thuringiensis]|nr:hypothetical protein [Bacillus thuringiensis]
MNLIQNGDFQQGLHFWNIEQGQIYIVEQQTKQSLMLDKQTIISQQIPVTEKTTYVFSFQIETEESDQVDIQIKEIYHPNHVFHENAQTYHINTTTPSPYEITTNTHVQSIQLTIINTSNQPIFIQQVDLQQIEINKPTSIPTHVTHTSSSHYKTLYREDFQPGKSIWEHTIINQNQKCGEAKKNVIGHIPTITLQPYTQYIVSMDIKLSEPCTQAAMIMMGIYHSVQPHTLFEQIEHTETTNDWVSLQLTYRTDQPQQLIDRIFVQSTVPFSFTNISIVEVEKLFQENFNQPSSLWNHVQIDTIDAKKAAYLESNTQISASVQTIPFQEKENYLATAYIKHTSMQDATATCYIEYKNNENGVFIRKPISIPSTIKTWEKIELPFTTPETPWSVSAIGFTYQGDQQLWITEVAIEPNQVSNHNVSKAPFETHTKWNPNKPSQKDIESIPILSTETASISPQIIEDEYMASAVTETLSTTVENLSDSITTFFDFSTLWQEYQQKQQEHYTKFLVDTNELSKIEQYINQKQIQTFSLQPNTKVMNLAALQHLDAIPTAYRIDHCLQQLTKECYIQNQIENIHTESYIQTFLQQIRFLFQKMNPKGIFLILPKQEDALPLVSYKNNQITLQAHTTVTIQNESFLQHLYDTYCFSSTSPFQSLDPLFHNLLYGMGLKWYEEMKTTYHVPSSILSTLYQNHKSCFEDWFSATFDTEEAYYATLFQIMYSPVFVPIAMALKQQLPPIVNPNITYTNGIDCIRAYMQQQ